MHRATFLPRFDGPRNLPLYPFDSTGVPRTDEEITVSGSVLDPSRDTITREYVSLEGLSSSRRLPRGDTSASREGRQLLPRTGYPNHAGFPYFFARLDEGRYAVNDDCTRE